MKTVFEIGKNVLKAAGFTFFGAMALLGTTATALVVKAKLDGNFDELSVDSRVTIDKYFGKKE